MLKGKEGGLSPAAERATYLIAGVIYIALGFVRKEVFAWWSYGAIWFVACAWFVPPAVRRLIHRTSRKADRQEVPEQPPS